jgi:hypothetical protein
MNLLNSTKTLITASVFGLVMALCSVAYPQPSDTGTAEATESPVAASENPTDIAPTEPTSPAEAPKAAADDAKTADSGGEPEAAPAETSADTVNPAKEDPTEAGKDIYHAFEAGKWLVAFGGILMFFVWIFRSVLFFFNVEWAQGELGGNIVAFGTAFTLAIGIALSAGQGLSIGLLSAAVGAGWLAKGQWSHAQARKAKAKAEASMGDTAAYEKGFSEGERKSQE